LSIITEIDNNFKLEFLEKEVLEIVNNNDVFEINQVKEEISLVVFQKVWCNKKLAIRDKDVIFVLCK